MTAHGLTGSHPGLPRGPRWGTAGREHDRECELNLQVLATIIRIEFACHMIDQHLDITAPHRQQEGAIMPDEVTPERVAAIAAAARVPLEQTSAARVANAVNPTVTRFAAQKIVLPLEVEPATYAVVARQGMMTK
jgi:hypothetical protein